MEKGISEDASRKRRILRFAFSSASSQLSPLRMYLSIIEFSSTTASTKINAIAEEANITSPNAKSMSAIKFSPL